MSNSTPTLILRLGSHAEKEYLQKTLPYLDSVIVGANLVEATPGATASLAVRMKGLIVDPMTYAFGSYVDRDTGLQRTDLDWIKSEQVGKTGKVRKFKKSYAALARQLGGIFLRALEQGRAVTPADLSEGTLADTCNAVLTYQRDRIANELRGDLEFASFVEDFAPPSVLFAPYFYIEPTQAQDWTDVSIRLAAESARQGANQEVHALVCADAEFLLREDFTARLKKDLPTTGVRGVWFWFSRFAEDSADLKTLESFCDLVRTLSKSMKVFNLHGGFFSLALSKIGLTGVSHGIGYGEQKDVIPVVGQSTPTVRYYLPPVRRKLGVPNIERSFGNLGITDPEQFFKKICDCVVCKGIVGKGLSAFSEFGDMHFSTPQSQKRAQTPAAAKRCRYHFLLRRLLERNWIREASLDQVLTELQAAEATWALEPTIREQASHLSRWRQVLSGA